MALKDPVTGKPLRTRPHWAKEWYGDSNGKDSFMVDGKPWYDRLKNEDYKTERREFVDILADIGKEAGWTLDDLKRRFSKDLFHDLIFGRDLVNASTNLASSEESLRSTVVNGRDVRKEPAA